MDEHLRFVVSKAVAEPCRGRLFHWILYDARHVPLVRYQHWCHDPDCRNHSRRQLCERPSRRREPENFDGRHLFDRHGEQFGSLQLDVFELARRFAMDHDLEAEGTARLERRFREMEPLVLASADDCSIGHCARTDAVPID